MASKTVRFSLEELDTIVGAVNTLKDDATEMRGNPTIVKSIDLTLAIADVQLRCSRIIDRIKKTELDPEAGDA